MEKFYVTRKQIETVAMFIHSHEYGGLCAAFSYAAPVFRGRKRYITDFLDACGGRRNSDFYYWPLNARGKRQRLTFLAFMLTWHDELTKAQG